MDQNSIEPLLEELEGNIDDLQEALGPLLAHSVSDSAGKLPVLDKAKLYVLVTYAIESLLFSYLRLYGTDAKEHPVFTELTRVKQYFGKIKEAEEAPAKRNLSLDKAAAGRIIKHGLSGNKKYDEDRAARQAKEKAGAEAKLKELTQKIEAERAAIRSRKRKAEAEPEPEEGNESSEDDAEAAEEDKTDVDDEQGASAKKRSKKSNSTKEERRARKEAKRAGKADNKSLKKHKNKSGKTMEKISQNSGKEELIIPDKQEKTPSKENSGTKKKKSSKAPMGSHDVFEKLLKGPSASNKT